AIATGYPSRPSRSSEKPGTIGTKPESAMIAAGLGRPSPRPSAYDMTAPCENPPRTTRSIGTGRLSRNAATWANVAWNVSGSGVGMPASRYQCAPPGGSVSGPRGVIPSSRRSGSRRSSTGKRSCSSAPRPCRRTSVPSGSVVALGRSSARSRVLIAPVRSRARPGPGRAWVFDRRQHRLDPLAQMLECGGQDEAFAQVRRILVDREPRSECRELEEDAVRLAKVDRAEPEAVDHRRRVHAGLRDRVLPGFLLGDLRREGNVMDGAGAADATVDRRRVVGEEPAASLPAHLPRALACRAEAEYPLEQLPARIRIDPEGPDAVEALECEVGGKLWMLRDQRPIRRRDEAQRGEPRARRSGGHAARAARGSR